MATKSSTIRTEKMQFNHIRKYIKCISGLDQTAVDAMRDAGIIQVSTAWEHALADTGGYQVVSLNDRDFNDACNSDGKICTVRYSSKLKGYSAPVSNFQGKAGSLRVGVLEPATDQMYYFHIPKSAWSKLKGKKTSLEIPFDHGGLPMRSNKWWSYEEKTFEDLAKNMVDPEARRTQRNDAKMAELFKYASHSGGKVKGQLSMTRDAVRKREARARAKMGVQN